jgi:hypothetical protein
MAKPILLITFPDKTNGSLIRETQRHLTNRLTEYNVIVSNVEGLKIEIIEHGNR